MSSGRPFSSPAGRTMRDRLLDLLDWLMAPAKFKRRWHVLIVLLAILELATWISVLIVRAHQ